MHDPERGEAALLRFVEGETRGSRLVRDAALDGAAVVRQAGQIMARLHAVTPPRSDLPFLSAPAGPALPARIAELRRLLDALPDPQPVLELGLRHLERHLPPPGPVVLTHCDFRTGNLIVHQGRIAAVLDWEFARWGDAREDLGWFTARCWRFGRDDRPAGGLGSEADLMAGYGAAMGDLRWFRLLATLRWAVIALQQAERHRSGGERSLELALTAHVVPRLERDVLDGVQDG
jgi:aminoglycoside phosphotransferase (APT) family kinase protein